jgi:(2Fe-2S) ferredoxin
VVVYPDGIWYGPVNEADVPELLDAHLTGTAPVTRLLVPEITPIW